MAVELDATAFKALSSKTRVELLKKLRDKPRSPTSLAHEMGLSVQAVDEHLRKLADAGLAEKRKHAKWTYYALTPAGQHLVAPSRQPVYVLLSIAFFLFMASTLTFMDAASATGAPAMADAARAANAVAEKPAAVPAPVNGVAESQAEPTQDLGAASDMAKQTQDAGAMDNAMAEFDGRAPLPQPSRELPWAGAFGFAGLSALVAAVVLWIRQNNRF
ncbi:MAG: winged helix-turn-helix domain-containing protein [Candidatus Micrarchaeota archaeon]|nr:winged helix-turn-helix domain-containing protein [Candidatus Micrarchaeota archaeon]